jgi:hypothetical protein
VLAGLREDALSSVPDGLELRIGLPWIRSLPLAGLTGLSALLDGRPLDPLTIVLADRRIAVDEAIAEVDLWWHLQDRLVLAAEDEVSPGKHLVLVDFRMTVPYLPGGPAGPLVLPFHLEAELELDKAVSPSVARDVGAERPEYV